MPNGMYGGVRGERKSPLLDFHKEISIDILVYGSMLMQTKQDSKLLFLGPVCSCKQMRV